MKSDSYRTARGRKDKRHERKGHSRLLSSRLLSLWESVLIKKAPLLRGFFTNQNETFLFFLGLSCLNNFFFYTRSLT